VANRPNAPATVERSQPPVLPARIVVNDLLTLPLKNSGELPADGDPGLDSEEALSGS
jgi:hypothetical protein